MPTSIAQNGYWRDEDDLSQCFPEFGGIYNGTGRLAETLYDVALVNSRIFASGTPTVFDRLDRFGRALKKNWTNNGGATVDEFNYTYDYASSRLTRDSNNGTTHDQTYTYFCIGKCGSALATGFRERCGRVVASGKDAMGSSMTLAA